MALRAWRSLLPARDAALPNTHSWEGQAELIARGIELGFIAAGATALLSLTFPVASYGSNDLAALLAAIAITTGLALMRLRMSGRWVATSWPVYAFATLVVSLGVYAGGAPLSGALLFYLWVVPCAFALLGTLEAVGLAAWMAICYGCVLGLQLSQHPGMGSSGTFAGLWFLAVATVCAVGILVRALSSSLREVDRRFDRAFRDSRVGAAFVSTDGHWLEANDALCRILGRGRAELIGRSLLEITPPGDRDATERALAEASRDGTTVFEKRYLRPGGEIVWVEVLASVITPETGPAYLFGQYRDVTAQRRDREALERQAAHDGLTGLFNRTVLLERLAAALARGDGSAVIVLDLDGFKVVNDSLGHRVGDEVLTLVAPRLATVLGPGDTLARLGGDEFGVLCTGVVRPLEAVERAKRLSAAVAEPVQLSSGRHALSASAGVVLARSAEDTPEALLRDADAAMYRAKARGRGQIVLFDEAMREEAIARLRDEDDLRSAIDERQFALVYQPIVDAETLRPIALEALIRWNHPTRGLLAPNAFIPLAEETGLITEIGEWVLDSACSQLAAWQRESSLAGSLQVTVNVSAVQLRDDAFSRQVARALRQSGLAPASLAVEITESAFMLDTTARAVAALQSLGVKTLLDDFGTGYSSLAYLTRFPIDVVKIDRTFVAGLGGGEQDAAVTKAILAIAAELELGVVAEGVESQRQLERLRALRCPTVQGFGISRPLPAGDVVAYLASLPHAVPLGETA